MFYFIGSCLLSLYIYCHTILYLDVHIAMNCYSALIIFLFTWVFVHAYLRYSYNET